jgi:Tetratricopeptide repeat
MMISRFGRSKMVAPSASVAMQRPDPELTGRWSDSLFGYGLLYLLSAPLIIWIGSSYGLSAWPTWFAMLIALGVSVPHYGATLLRVYEKRNDRRRYAFFSVWITLVLVGCFLASLYSAPLGSWLITIYVCWSPWHFAGQNFGVSMMSLRRRSVPVDKTTRAFLQGSFALAYLLAMLAIQTEGARPEVALDAIGAGEYEVYRLGIPYESAIFALWTLLATYVAVTFTALFRLARAGNARHLGPTVMLLATHSLWYVLPAASGGQIPLIYTAVWISAFHSLQYLWITTYYAKQTDATRAGKFFGKCLLVGSAVGAIPPLLFVPGLLGPFVPYAASAAVIFFSVLNIHHFILDGAIWKLRDSRVGRILLSQSTAGDDHVEDEAGHSFIQRAVYALGAVAAALPLYYITEAGIAVSSTTHSVVEGAAGRLAFLGRDNADVFFVLGQHRNLAGDVKGAKVAYRKALELEPNHADVAYRLASLLLRDPESRNEALGLAELASQLSDHSNAAALLILGRAYASVGRRGEARSAFERALDIAVNENDSELARISRQRLRQLGPGGAANDPASTRGRQAH